MSMQYHANMQHGFDVQSWSQDKTKAFGIDSANVFGFWDWVGALTLKQEKVKHFFLVP